MNIGGFFMVTMVIFQNHPIFFSTIDTLLCFQIMLHNIGSQRGRVFWILKNVQLVSHGGGECECGGGGGCG